MTRRVILGLPEWNLNGVCIFAANLVRALNARGHDARLFITEEGSPLVDYPRVGAPPPADIPVDRLRLTAYDRWSDAWIGVERYLEEQAPCVYIPNHDFRASCVTPRLSERVTVIGMIHADNALEYEHVGRLARHWDAVVAVNPSIRRRAAMEMPWLASRLAAIPIGVPLPARVAERTPSDVLRLVYHGELRAHQKRVLDLVGMLDLLVARGVRAQLTLVGDGPARADIEARGKSLIAAGHLVLRGALPHAETLAELERHDVYVLASEFEGTPNAMLEAMARGCVPVVSDLETLASVVAHDDNGLRFPPGDVDAFATAVASLAAAPARRAAMAARAAATVRDGTWALDAMVSAWIALFERVEQAKAASPRRPRARMSPPAPTMGGVSILPGRFDGSARLANRVPMWPDPLPPAERQPTRAPHTAPLADHRIVFAATSGRISGVDIFAVHLVRALVARGFNAEILVTRPDEPVPDPLPFPADVAVRRLTVTPRTSWRARWRLLVNDLERDGAPVLYVPNYDWRHSGISPTLASTVKIVGIVHSDDPQHYEHALRLGEAWNGIVAVSDAIAHEMQALAPRFTPRLETIPYGVPVPPSAVPRSRQGGEPLRIVYAGRLARYQKRALDLVGIADALVARNIPFELTVAGGGPDQGDFLGAAARHLVEGRMRFVGGLPNEMVQELLTRADAFLLPSAFEGLPVALLEAMACGAVPVVSDIRSGVRQVVRDGENGYVVAPGDVQGFADRLAELARDPALVSRMSYAAHRAVHDGPFTIDAMCEHYLAFFDRVAREPFARPVGAARHPGDITGLRAWLPPELPTPVQVSARLRQLARGAVGAR